MKQDRSLVGKSRKVEINWEKKKQLESLDKEEQILQDKRHNLLDDKEEWWIMAEDYLRSVISELNEETQVIADSEKKELFNDRLNLAEN